MGSVIIMIMRIIARKYGICLQGVNGSHVEEILLQAVTWTRIVREITNTFTLLKLMVNIRSFLFPNIGNLISFEKGRFYLKVW